MESLNIQNKVFTIRGMRVMIDFHLAELYNVETKALNQGVKRNLRRFPDDFMFQLTEKEWRALKSEIAILKAESETSNSLTHSAQTGMWSQIVTTSKRRKGHTPFVFTEQGVAMLSSILKSERAIDVNIAIMRIIRYPAPAPHELRRALSKNLNPRKANEPKIQRHPRSPQLPHERRTIIRNRLQTGHAESLSPLRNHVFHQILPI